MSASRSFSGPPEEYLEYSCWRVPLHMRDMDWTTLLSSPEVTDKLVLPDASSHVWKVLSKMECPGFIHCFMRGHEVSDRDPIDHTLISGSPVLGIRNAQYLFL